MHRLAFLPFTMALLAGCTATPQAPRPASAEMAARAALERRTALAEQAAEQALQQAARVAAMLQAEQQARQTADLDARNARLALGTARQQIADLEVRIAQEQTLRLAAEQAQRSSAAAPAAEPSGGHQRGKAAGSFSPYAIRGIGVAGGKLRP